jgi:hypothetical protein
MHRPVPRRAPKHAVWSAPARLRKPPAAVRPAERRAPLRGDNRKLPILVANFALFLLYVFALIVLASDPESEVRLALPLALAVLGLAGFAPLALAFARRDRNRPTDRRRT